MDSQGMTDSMGMRDRQGTRDRQGMTGSQGMTDRQGTTDSQDSPGQRRSCWQRLTPPSAGHPARSSRPSWPILVLLSQVRGLRDERWKNTKTELVTEGASWLFIPGVSVTRCRQEPPAGACREAATSLPLRSIHLKTSLKYQGRASTKSPFPSVRGLPLPPSGSGCVCTSLSHRTPIPSWGLAAQAGAVSSHRAAWYHLYHTLRPCGFPSPAILGKLQEAQLGQRCSAVALARSSWRPEAAVELLNPCTPRAADGGECLQAGKGEQESEKQIWFHSVISHFALQLPQRGAWAGSCLCCASGRGSGGAGTSPVLTTSMRPSSRCPSFLPSSP